MFIVRSLVCILVIALAGCSDGLLHRIDLQQGNLVTEQMIKQLKPGMDREQVLFVMGQPILRNSFDPARWDYIYTFARRGQILEMRYVTLYFENDVLTRLVGNYEELDPTKTSDREGEEI